MILFINKLINNIYMDQVEELEDFYEENDDKEYQTKMLEKIL